MKLLKTFIILTLLIVQINSEPFIAILTLAFQLLSAGVTVALVLTGLAIKAKVVIESVKMFSIKNQIDALRLVVSTPSNFLINEFDGDLLEFKTQAINNSKVALAAYKDFQKANEPVCRNFFTDKIQKYFYNLKQAINADAKQNVLNILKAKDLLKSAKKDEISYVSFKYNEIININGLDTDRPSLLTQAMDEVKDAVQTEIDETIQEAKEEVADEVLKTAKAAVLNTLGVPDVETFINNARQTYDNYKVLEQTMENVKKTYDNLGAAVAEKVREEATESFEALKGAIYDTGSFLKEKYERYFGNERLEGNGVFFMCDMIYVTSLKVVEGTTVCVNIDFISSEYWEDVEDYVKLHTIITENNNTRQVCFDIESMNEFNAEKNRVYDAKANYEEYLLDQWNQGFYSYFTANPQVIEEISFDDKNIFFDSFISLYSLGISNNRII